MIEFSCRCGHPFSVNNDLAGGLVQCPQCKRLNDIPNAADLADIDNEGIYKIDAPPPHPDDQRVPELTTVYTRDHFDADGNPIDIRGSFTGKGGPVPVESLGPLDAAPPKYDPMTGELIRDIDVKPETRPDPQTLPVARRVIAPPTRVDGVDVPLAGEAWMIPARLFKSVNLLVMFFILLTHVFAASMMTAIAAFAWFLFPAWLVVHALIVAHYGNVIDETGPTSHTDLPTPLRNVEWHDDTFGPFTRVLSAVVVCYGPGVMLLSNAGTVPAHLLLPLSAAMIAIGTIFFPAAILTTTTSGSLLNLRPDRLVAVMYIGGSGYFASLLLWTIAAPLLGLGVVGTTWLAAAALQPSIHPPAWLNWPLAGASLVAGTYVMHLFCCHLGLLYRKHFMAFPWLYQRHEGRKGPPQAKGFPVGRPPAARGKNQSPNSSYKQKLDAGV